MNLPFPVALALEKAINAVLSLDPETCERLESIDGCVVRINVTRPTLAVMLAVADGKIFLSQVDNTSGADPDADVVITGSLLALRSLLDGNDAVYTGDVTIEGDIGISQNLKQIVARVDPDWQDAISPYLGDTLTHRPDRAQSRFADWVQRSGSSARSNTSEYLQEEIELLAPNAEVHDFCRQVDTLRADADRLAVRIQRLEASIASETAEP